MGWKPLLGNLFEKKAAGGGGGGATIAHTTNVIVGNGAGNGADSGIHPEIVATAPSGITGNLATYAISPELGDSGIAVADLIPAIANANSALQPATVQSLPDGTTAVTQTELDSSTKVATTAYVDGYGFLTSDGDLSTTTGTNADMDLQSALGHSSITPAADGTYTPVTSITIVSGIITAIS